MNSFSFSYNKLGRGNLSLQLDGETYREWPCRCGSIDTTGALVHATPPGTYKIMERANFTQLEPMCIGGLGWWCVLFDASNNRTHLGIHPDGGLGGTNGCIGTQGTDIPLMDYINQYLKEQGSILVEVSQS